MSHRSRRKVLLTASAVAGSLISGCSADQQNSGTAGTGATDTEEPTEEVTEEPVELPRVIGESEIPSFDSVYTPSEWAPENYSEVMSDVDVSGIENEYNTRSGQVRNLLAEVMSSEEYRRDQHGAILAGLNAVHELSWADEETVFADDVTATSGGVGSMLELVFEDEGGELEHSAMIFGGEYTDSEDYIEDLPNSTYHDGSQINMVHSDYDAFIERVNADGQDTLEENGWGYVNGSTNNFVFGPNDGFHSEIDEETDILVGDDYWQNLSEAVDEDTQTYLNMKKELSQYAGAVSEGNALSVYKEDGETVYQEISADQFGEQMPFGPNWNPE